MGKRGPQPRIEGISVVDANSYAARPNIAPAINEAEQEAIDWFVGGRDTFRRKAIIVATYKLFQAKKLVI